MTEQTRKVEPLGKARKHVLSALKEGYKVFHARGDESIKQSAYSAIYSAVWQYSDSYQNEHKCGSPLLSAAGTTNRYVSFAENVINPTISEIRKKTFAEFNNTIDGFSPYLLPEFLTPQVKKEEQSAELTSFFLDLAINASTGFLANNQSPQSVLVADMFFEKGRQKYFDYEGQWWRRNVYANEKKKVNAVTDEMNAQKLQMQTMIASLDQIALEGWKRLHIVGGHIERVQRAAIEDFGLRIEDSVKMYGQLSHPDQIDLSFLTVNRT